MKTTSAKKAFRRAIESADSGSDDVSYKELDVLIYKPWIGTTKVPVLQSPSLPGFEAAIRREWSSRWLKYWPVRPQSQSIMKQPHAWELKAKKQGIRHKVFHETVFDFTDTKIPPLWRTQYWKTIHDTPHLDWFVTTEQVNRIEQFLPKDWGDGYKNVILGASFREAHKANSRIAALRTIPSHRRFAMFTGWFEPGDVTSFEGMDVIGFCEEPAHPYFQPIDWSDVPSEYFALLDVDFLIPNDDGSWKYLEFVRKAL